MEKVLAVTVMLGFALFIIGVQISDRVPHYYRRPRSVVVLVSLGTVMILGGLYGIIRIAVG